MNFNHIDTFNRYIKPRVYEKVNPFISELTGITTGQLMKEEEFQNVYDDFIQFIGDMYSFCIWGMSDIRILFKNIDYHKIDNKSMPRSYINLQPYASKFLGRSTKRLLGLVYTLEELNIDTQYKFHNAANDAYYTAEIFKKIYNPTIMPMVYDPNYIKPRPQKIKTVINYDALFQQFKKMHNKDLTDEEQKMIKLAYLMGRTQ